MDINFKDEFDKLLKIHKIKYSEISKNLNYCG